jgi:hypothetical protein
MQKKLLISCLLLVRIAVGSGVHTTNHNVPMKDIMAKLVLMNKSIHASLDGLGKEIDNMGKEVGKVEDVVHKIELSSHRICQDLRETNSNMSQVAATLRDRTPAAGIVVRRSAANSN